MDFRLVDSSFSKYLEDIKKRQNYLRQIVSELSSSALHEVISNTPDSIEDFAYSVVNCAKDDLVISYEQFIEDEIRCKLKTILLIKTIKELLLQGNKLEM
jgi:hypothetical protein